MNGCLLLVRYFVREEKEEDIVIIYRRCLLSVIIIWRQWYFPLGDDKNALQQQIRDYLLLFYNAMIPHRSPEQSIISSYTSHDHRNNDPQKENAHFSIRKYNLLYYCRSTLLWLVSMWWWWWCDPHPLLFAYMQVPVQEAEERAI